MKLSVMYGHIGESIHHDLKDEIGSRTIGIMTGLIKPRCVMSIVSPLSHAWFHRSKNSRIRVRFFKHFKDKLSTSSNHLSCQVGKYSTSRGDRRKINGKIKFSQTLWNARFVVDFCQCSVIQTYLICHIFPRNLFNHDPSESEMSKMSKRRYMLMTSPFYLFIESCPFYEVDAASYRIFIAEGWPIKRLHPTYFTIMINVIVMAMIPPRSLL